jgi:hypothetical protein
VAHVAHRTGGFSFLQKAASRRAHNYADAGMRNQKEVFTMLRELDWSNSRYFLYDSKTSMGRRHVPISPRILQALLVRYSNHKEGWSSHQNGRNVAINDGRAIPGCPEGCRPAR